MSDPIVAKEAEADVVAEIEADAEADVDADADASPVLRNQIKVTAVGRIYKYVTYARDLLSKSPNEIVIRAMGGAVSNAITVANLLRRGVLGLAQITDITSKGVESNAKRPEHSVVPQVVIRLSTNFSDEDKKHYGFQEALPEDQHVPFEDRPRAPQGEASEKQGEDGSVIGAAAGGQSHHPAHGHQVHHYYPLSHHHHHHGGHHMQQQHHHSMPHHHHHGGHHAQHHHHHQGYHPMQQQHHMGQHQGDQGQGGGRRQSYGRYPGGYGGNTASLPSSSSSSPSGAAPSSSSSSSSSIAANNAQIAGVASGQNPNYYGGRGGGYRSRDRSGPYRGRRAPGGAGAGGSYRSSPPSSAPSPYYRGGYGQGGYGQGGRQPRLPYEYSAGGRDPKVDGRGAPRRTYQPKTGPGANAEALSAPAAASSAAPVAAAPSLASDASASPKDDSVAPSQ